MIQFYILKGKEPVEASLLEWAEMFESSDRFLFRTTVHGVRVITAFHGHDFGGAVLVGEEPNLFGTLIKWKQGSSGEERLWATWDEAATGHAQAVSDVIRVYYW